jgi:hypothetical protein
VKADSVILELTNPQLEQQLQDGELKLAAAVAGLENLKVQLNNDLLTTRAAAATVEANYNKAKMQAADERSAREGQARVGPGAQAVANRRRLAGR